MPEDTGTEAAEQAESSEQGEELTAQEAVERAAEQSDAGKPPEGGALAIKDVRYLGAGVKVSEPDADGFQAVTFLIDSRTQHTYVFGPETAGYIHGKTMPPGEKELLIAGADELPPAPEEAQ